MWEWHGKKYENKVKVNIQRSFVKPPNKGHIGDGPVVPCREVVLFSEVFF